VGCGARPWGNRHYAKQIFHDKVTGDLYWKYLLEKPKVTIKNVGTNPAKYPACLETDTFTLAKSGLEEITIDTAKLPFEFPQATYV